MTLIILTLYVKKEKVSIISLETVGITSIKIIDMNIKDVFSTVFSYVSKIENIEDFIKIFYVDNELLLSKFLLFKLSLPNFLMLLLCTYLNGNSSK